MTITSRITIERGIISNEESQREKLSMMDAGSLNANENVESSLQKLGIDCDLSIKKNHDRFKDILGDLISLQQQFYSSEKEKQSSITNHRNRLHRMPFV